MKLRIAVAAAMDKDEIAQEVKNCEKSMAMMVRKKGWADQAAKMFKAARDDYKAGKRRSAEAKISKALQLEQRLSD